MGPSFSMRPSHATRPRLVAVILTVLAATLGETSRQAIAAEYTATELYTIPTPPAGQSLNLFSSGPGGTVAGVIGSAAVLFSPSDPSGEVFPGGAGGVLLRDSGAVNKLGAPGNGMPHCGITP